MAYDAITVARHIVKYSNSQDSPISNLKLQKILYFVQAEFLVSTKKPCFSDVIEAWDFGPVVPAVYRKYKIYGSGNIPSEQKALFEIIREEDLKLIDDMTDQCLKYTAAALVEITHHQDPWLKNYKRNFRREIPVSEIQSYFEEIQ